MYTYVCIYLCSLHATICIFIVFATCFCCCVCTNTYFPLFLVYKFHFNFNFLYFLLLLLLLLFYFANSSVCSVSVLVPLKSSGWLIFYYTTQLCALYVLYFTHRNFMTQNLLFSSRSRTSFRSKQLLSRLNICTYVYMY